MDIAMDPAIAFRVPSHEGPALEVRVNFGVYAGRNATAAEIDDLARALRPELSNFTVIAEARHEFGNDVETSLHQVVIEVDSSYADDLSEAICERIVATADRWANACIASRSELGELRES
jgi:DNA-binding IscR family transcriptional regulator